MVPLSRQLWDASVEFPVWQDLLSPRSMEGIAVQNQGTRTGVPLTVYPWYLLCSLGILGDYNP